MTDIKCAGGCGTVLGNIELHDNEEYKGDLFYGMYCPNCSLPKPPENEIDILKRQLQELIDSLKS